MILENEKSKFLHILEQIKVRRAKTFTQKEVSEILNVSLRKFIDFENGKIYDFWLLCRYADLFGYEVLFDKQYSINN